LSFRVQEVEGEGVEADGVLEAACVELAGGEENDAGVYPVLLPEDLWSDLEREPGLREGDPDARGGRSPDRTRGRAAKGRR
jgi:hypothetical protein